MSCLKLNIRLVHHGDASINNFTQIMRRNFRCKPSRNPADAINQQIRITGGQNNRFFGCIIKVIFKQNGAFLDIAQQLHRDVG